MIRKYIQVECKDCGVKWDKREDSIKDWGGVCKSCSSKEKAQRPGMKEIMRANGKKIIEVYGKIPNCGKGVLAGDKNPSWKGGQPKCTDCGIQVSYGKKRCLKCNGKSKRGLKRTDEYKQMLRTRMPKGDKHWNWNNGSSGEATTIRMSAPYKDWRTAVFERDNYTCQDCGDRSREGNPVTLNADHIKPFSMHPDLRFDISNGKTLCVECHRKTDTFGIKMFNKNRAIMQTG